MTKIRRATQGDEAAIAHVHIKSWQEAYEGLIPQEYLDQLPSKIDVETMETIRIYR